MEKIINSDLYRFLTKITNFIYATMLCVVGCIPVITIFHSISALYAVFNELEKDDSIEVTRYFIKSFKNDFLKKILYEILVAILLISFVLGFWIIQNFNNMILTSFWTSLTGILVGSFVLNLISFESNHLQKKSKKKIKICIQDILIYFPSNILTLVGFIIGYLIMRTFSWTFMIVLPLSMVIFVKLRRKYDYKYL